MKPSCVYTLNELQTLVPSLRKEHLLSKDENIKKHIIKMFWHLGCDATEGIEIQEGVVCRNRFNRIDDSARVIVNERLDQVWVESKYASEFAKLYTKDVGVMNDIDRLRNRRSYDNDVDSEC